jgi:hypothetical protein
MRETGSTRPVVVSQVREAVGGTLAVVGGVGCLAGQAVDTVGDLLKAATGLVGGAVLLLGDALDATGAGLGMALGTVGRTVGQAGVVVGGRRGPGPGPDQRKLPGVPTAAPTAGEPKTAAPKRKSAPPPRPPSRRPSTPKAGPSRPTPSA